MNRFAYYHRLTPGAQRTYRKSDRITRVRLPEADAFGPMLKELARALVAEDRGAVESSSQEIADGILVRLGVTRVQVVVREVRPSNPTAELHGLYEPVDPPYRSRISLWMRTAARAQVVAYKTFLRTLIHEICHHLDYELFGLAESLHTRGFYQRESSLVRQLVQPEASSVEIDRDLNR